MKNHPEISRDLNVPSQEMMTEENQMKMVAAKQWLDDNLLNESKIQAMANLEAD
jgi:hypothetical protein